MGTKESCLLGAAGLSLLVPALTAGVAWAQCEPVWSPGFEAPRALLGVTLSKAVEFDDGNGPAIFALGFNSSRVYRFQNGAWSQVGTPFYGGTSGVSSGRVLDIIVFENELYVSGAFQRVGTTGLTGANGSPSSVARGVAKWSPTTGIGGSFVPAAGTVFQGDGVFGVAGMAIQDFGDGPRLYATGNLGGGQRLAVYEGGTSWTIIQSITDDLTRSIVAYTDAQGPKLALGGDFTFIDNANAGYVAAYNGFGFEEIFPSGFFTGGAVYQLAASAIDDSLFIYGFGRSSSETEGSWGILRWDETTMHRMSPTSPTTFQLLYSVDDGINPGQSVYFNGLDNGAVTLYRWTGTAAVEAVPGSSVSANGLVGFDPDGPGPEPRRLVTDGSKALLDGDWTDLELSNQDGKGGVGFDVLIPFDADGAGPEREVLVGFVASGSMPTTNQGVMIPRVGSYDGGFIVPFGGGLEDLTPADSSTMNFHTATVFDDGTGPALYVGGTFGNLGATPVNHLLKFDGTSWSGVEGGVLSIADAEVPGRHSVRALQVVGGNLFVGGHFDQVGGSIPSPYLAIWTGSSWTPGPAGLPGPVFALALHDDGTGQTLYAATTQRPEAPDPSQVAIFRLDGSTWTQLGAAGFNATAMASYNGDLYVTGSFASVDGVTYNHIARWDGSAWSPLGTGLTSVPGRTGTPIRGRLRVGPDVGGTGNVLYVGSRFSRANGIDTGAIAKWDGTNFSSVGEGLFNDATSTINPTVTDLAFYDDGRGLGLFASGLFTRSGSLETRNLGRFGVPTPAWRAAPVNVTATAGDTVVLTFGVEPTIAVSSLQWQRDGIDLVDDGVYSGVATDTLTITGISASEAGSYACVMVNSCGTSITPAAVVTVPTLCPPCAADYDNNGGVDGGDLAAFFADFESGETCADVDGNGGVDGGDLGFFFTVFEQGGC